jgi:hypothetical protein
VPSRAWVDYPRRIWVEGAYQGAIYSPVLGSVWRPALRSWPPAVSRLRMPTANSYPMLLTERGWGGPFPRDRASQ